MIEVTGPRTRRVRLGDRVVECDWRDGWWIDGQKAPGRIVTHSDGVSLFGPVPLHGRLRDPLARDADAHASDITLSPMPGLVKAVFVAPGQGVQAGDRLAILEAMKMEHTLTAGRAGRVAEVLVTAGAQVEAGQALIRLEDTE